MGDSSRSSAVRLVPADWRSRLREPRTWLWIWVVWFVVLFGLSSIPGENLTFNPFDFFDKVEHAGYFFGGGLLLGGWLVADGRWPARWWWLPAAAMLGGAFDELHQWFTPGRSGLDLWDWVADVTGGSIAIGPVHLWNRWQAGTRARPRV